MELKKRERMLEEMYAMRDAPEINAVSE